MTLPARGRSSPLAPLTQLRSPSFTFCPLLQHANETPKRQTCAPTPEIACSEVSAKLPGAAGMRELAASQVGGNPHQFLSPPSSRDILPAQRRNCSDPAETTTGRKCVAALCRPRPAPHPAAEVSRLMRRLKLRRWPLESAGDGHGGAARVLTLVMTSRS